MSVTDVARASPWEATNPGASAVPARPVESRDPWTGELLARWPAADETAVRAAVSRARAAQPAWGARPARERAALLRRFRDLLFAARDEVAESIARETGKPVGEALAAEVAVMLDDAVRCARRGPALLRSERRWPRNPALWRKRVEVRRVPLGVVAVIAPWNYPMMLAAGHILPALVAGNTVVFKPSEYAPASGALLVRLLHEAGVPPDVLELVQGDGRTGAALAGSEVDFVCFTGSEAAGAAVARRCGERMIPCSLELGATDAAIVLADAPLPHTARGLVWARHMNGGQSCVAPKRVLVVESIHAALVEALRAEMARLRVGPSAEPTTDIGPLIRERQAAGVRAMLDDAIRRGATVCAEAPLPPEAPSTAVAPTVLDGLADGMRAWDEELFGPVLALRVVRDEAEAIRLANASAYGLSASVWSRDRRRARAIAARLEAGTVEINGAVDIVGIAEVPHGGVKRSGYGRVHGDEAILELTRTHTVVDDVLPSLRNPWWFGYSAAQRRDFSRFLGLVHGRTVADRLRGVAATLRLLRGYPPGR